MRLGTPAGTTRGFGVEEFRTVGRLITRVVDGLAKSAEGDASAEASAREEALDLCRRFPIYA